MNTVNTSSGAAARRDEANGYAMHERWYADPYAWMERLNEPEAQAWIAAQEAATRAALDSVPGRNRLQEAVAQAARYERVSRPMRAGQFEFLWHAGPTDDKQRLLMRRGLSGPLETVLDPNSWLSDEVLVFATPSPDGSLVAFGKASGGTHGATIQVLDRQTGYLLPDRPYGTGHESLAWLPDGSGFLYAACPESGDVAPGDEAYWHAVYEHRLGADRPARRIFGDEQHKEYWCSVTVSECGRFAVLIKWDFVHANVIFLYNLTDGSLTSVAPAMRSINQLQVIGDVLLITTDLDAPRGRLCTASLNNPTAWQTLIPEGPNTLQTVQGVGGRLYAVYSQAAAHRVHIYTIDGTYLHELELPALGSVNSNMGSGVVSGISGSWNGDEVWVQFQSFVQPPSLYRYDAAIRKLTPYHRPDAGLDPDDYITKQVWYESLDGTRVSMFLVYRSNLALDGRLSVRLSGYGGFNIAVEPRFTALQAAWLRQGGILAFPNIRGGGEYGRSWHEAARTTSRQNAFDDYIAAARWLVAEGYTTPARLISRGNSNGGLLVAATVLQAPEVFGAVVSRAALLDMLRFPSFRHMASAITEYGDPADPVEGAYLAGYSPYHNVRADRPYPAMLFIAALNDQLAPPYDPCKMIARFQAEAPQGGPYLLLPLHGSGHSGGTTQTALIEQDVDELSFYFMAISRNADDGASRTT